MRERPFVRASRVQDHKKCVRTGFAYIVETDASVSVRCLRISDPSCSLTTNTVCFCWFRQHAWHDSSGCQRACVCSRAHLQTQIISVEFSRMRQDILLVIISETHTYFFELKKQPRETKRRKKCVPKSENRRRAEFFFCLRSYHVDLKPSDCVVYHVGV